MKQWMLMLTVLTLAVAGCRHVNPPIEGRNDPYVPPQIQFTGLSLRDDTAVGKIKTSVDNAGILTVVVPIRSTRNSSFYVDWRVTFFDATGKPMGPTTGWSQKMLAANTSEYITTNSLQPGAADFQIDIRRSE